MRIFKTKWFHRWAAKEGLTEGGARTLIAYRSGHAVFFMYGFPKNERANIESDELKALRLLARELLGYSEQSLARAVEAGELIEVSDNGKA
jgi:hypothetical protein